jgi:DNA-binding NarL/FixJ family response regulator
MTPSSSPLSILIVDTAPATALGLQHFLTDSKYGLTILPHAHNIQAAIDTLEQCSVDVVLLNSQLFLQSELRDYIHQPQSRLKHTQILLHGQEQASLPELTVLLAHRVRGFIHLSATADEWHHAIQHIATGGLLFAGGLLTQSHSQTPNVYYARLYSLWRQEQRVLRLLAAGWKKEQIAKRMKISLKTVQKYQTHILKKLEAKSAFELLNQDFLDALERLPDEPVDVQDDPTEEPNETEI